MDKEKLHGIISASSLAVGLGLLVFGRLLGFLFVGFALSFIRKLDIQGTEIKKFSRKALIIAAIFVILLFVIEVYVRNPYMTQENRRLMVIQSFLNEFTMFALFLAGFLFMAILKALKFVDKIDLVLK